MRSRKPGQPGQPGSYEEAHSNLIDKMLNTFIIMNKSRVLEVPKNNGLIFHMVKGFRTVT